jgi:hypothetical protein
VVEFQETTAAIVNGRRRRGKMAGEERTDRWGPPASEPEQIKR